MRTRVFIVLLADTAFACVLLSFGQDQSVADAARQSRLEKQKQTQSQDSAATAPENQAKTHHVITNDEIPEHEGSDSASSMNSQPHRAVETPPAHPQGKLSAGEWRFQIQSQKNAITSLQNEIARLSASIHFPVSCLRNCPERTERQLQKENRVEIMKTQLDQQQKHLEEMQESARRQGFGNSVYDP
jgi:hypothetical protein